MSSSSDNTNLFIFPSTIIDSHRRDYHAITGIGGKEMLNGASNRKYQKVYPGQFPQLC
jgi:hypothetical protein